MDLARRYLAPPQRGIEIGASTITPFPGVAAWNLEHPKSGTFRTAQERIEGDHAPVAVYGDGGRLPFGAGALDFVLSSHVLEHMPDTIRALGEWDRVVRPGGTVFMIVPHRERTFDRPRPRTELEHHLADYALGMDGGRNPLVPESHYHVWITEDVVRLVEHLNAVGYLDWELLEVEDVDSMHGNGFTLVARKRSTPAAPGPGSPDAEVAFHHLALDLPFQITLRTTEAIVPGPDPGPLDHLPRGRYRCTPIHAGFPPVAGPTRALDLGDPVPAPSLTALGLEDGHLRFRGEALTPTTYLVARFPDGEHPVFPEFRDGDLFVPVEGIVFPPQPFEVHAVNLPPGGGPGPPLTVREHLG